VTPEQIGLCGCWQIIAVYRDRIQLDREADSSESTIAYYVTSRTKDESSDQELLMAIRGHWSAIENGVHYRRDVSFGEDQCVSQIRSLHT
jgi:predicted transposase YbfD/YdcC